MASFRAALLAAFGFVGCACGGDGGSSPGRQGGAAGSGQSPGGGSGGEAAAPDDVGAPPQGEPGEAVDPSAISFDWPEGAAGGRTCLAGRYAGGFVCDFAQGADCASNTGGLPFAGRIELTLVETQRGEFLEVSDGLLTGDTAGFVFGGPISGSLDCVSQLFAGEVHGSYDGFFGALAGQFGGPLTAVYAEQGPALVHGAWCMTMTEPGTAPGDPCAGIPSGEAGSCIVGSCKGGWDAAFVP